MNITNDMLCFLALKHSVPVEVIRAVLTNINKLTSNSGFIRDAGRDAIRDYLEIYNIDVNVFYSSVDATYNNISYVDTEIHFLDGRIIVNVSDIIKWADECK